MPTISTDTNAGVILPVNARTDTTIKIGVLTPQDTKKNITNYAFRAVFRINEGGRKIKSYSTTGGGGITLACAPSGVISIAVDASDLHPAPNAVMEVVEYSGGAHTGDPTDRFRFKVPIQGGDGVGH